MGRNQRRNEGRDGGRKGSRPERAAWTPPTDRARPGRAADEDRSARGPRGQKSAAGASDWLWGWHAVAAALANPSRAAPRRLVATAEQARRLAALPGAAAQPEILEAAEIARLLPAGAAHQGVAMQPGALEPLTLDEIAESARGVLVMLDQVTEPQNVGAVMRSAAAFGARGVIVQHRHAPPFAGAVAKAAAGALDVTPHARVVNLARALERLEELGWRAIGLAGGATETLAEVLDGRPTVLVLGSEGEGLRRLVGEHCDALARIPMPGGFESLNVSAAAAIALYEATRPR
ncbi:MAG TPA: 23S rRNA (guanosine(2251)-2'-O)-methyltransferase RlmB [Caulobacteraceae bacterium]|nr:23S rRNA (guanosine(2251)-2'-O)-methyltransferase RlmB [Caulobacteraceae bacterium]